MNPENYLYLSALLPDGTAAESSVSRVLVARGTVRSAPAMADDVPAVERQLSGRAGDQRDPSAHPSASSRDEEETS